MRVIREWANLALLSCGEGRWFNEFEAARLRAEAAGAFVIGRRVNPILVVMPQPYR